MRFLATASTMLLGSLDDLAFEVPLIFVESIYAAGLSLVIVVLYFGWEWNRQRTFIKEQNVGDAQHATLSPACARFVREREVDVHCVIAALTGLAAKGYISFRHGIETLSMTNVWEKGKGEALSGDERAVWQTFVGEKNYIDFGNIWPADLELTMEALRKHFSGQPDLKYFRDNRPFSTRAWVLTLILFIVVLLTRTNPVQIVALVAVFIPCFVLVWYMSRDGIRQWNIAWKQRPPFMSLFRRNPLLVLQEYFYLAGALGQAGYTLGLFVFCSLFFGLILLAALHATLGLGTAGVLIVMIFVSVKLWFVLRLIPTDEGAKCLAQVRVLLSALESADDPGQVFAREDSQGVGYAWAYLVGLGFFDSAVRVKLMASDDTPDELPQNVPWWFEKSGGDATVGDLATFLGVSLADTMNKALRGEPES